MPEDYKVKWTSLVAASRARTFRRRVRAKDSAASAPGSGSNSSASSASANPRGSSSKTARTFELAGLSESSKDLPRSGLMRRGIVSAVCTSAPPKNGSVSGWLPTTTTTGNDLSPTMQKWPAHQRLAKLMDKLREDGILPTPTPTARLYGYNQGGAKGRVSKKRPSIETLAGGLSLSLREWMMGWPIGWSELQPLATDRFQQWLRWLGAS